MTTTPLNAAADTRARLSRRRVLQGLAGGLVTLPVVGGWTLGIEPHWLEMTHHELSIPNLPQQWRGKTMVQMSDLHIGSTNEEYLQSVIAQVNGLNADLLVLTGDILDYRFRGDADAVERLLSRLDGGRIATLACLGNHDYGRRWRQVEVADRVASATQNQGITVLRDQQLELDGIDIFGLDELLSPRFQASEVLRQAKPDRASICLCHNPDMCDRPVWGDFTGVILAGHTHGGQCKPPFLPPPRLPVRNSNYVSGFYDLGAQRELFISRGIGYGLRARFNCRPEVAVFTLA